MPCEQLATTSDELVVERLNAAPLGSRELLRTGRIGTKVGLTGDGRSILMDQRGELLCVHGEANAGFVTASSNPARRFTSLLVEAAPSRSRE